MISTDNVRLGSINDSLIEVFAAKRVGRPPVADPASERSRKPWIAEGISQRTFYRRKAVAAAQAPEPAQQQGAHVAAWYATLNPIARLEHRAFVRRCLMATSRIVVREATPRGVA